MKSRGLPRLGALDCWYVRVDHKGVGHGQSDPPACAPHRLRHLSGTERPPPIEVRNLNKQYKDGPHANQDISLTVNWGEALGVLGPNGAGKTTLVRQITTELLPTSGEVRVVGIDAVANPDGAKARIGVVPQEARLFQGLSVYRHLRIFGVLRGLSRRDARQRADELIEELDLTAHRDFNSERLSGGLRRRLLVGIAMLAQPDVLILDEPTVGLDVESRQRLWEVLQSYRQRDAAVLLTTHYMEEAETLCDRIGIIQDGRLISLDTISNLRASIGHEYKLVYESSEGRQTVYGDDHLTLAAQLRAQGIDEYAVMRTSLEDVYLALTQQARDEGEANAAN